MITLLSPAKNLDFDSDVPVEESSKCRFLDEAEHLVSKLRDMKPAELEDLMGISGNLAELNYERYQQWKKPLPKKDSRQAVYAFNGDVYRGLDAYNLSGEAVAFAQDHLRILSGLYGILRPLDRILPYRLEMGTKMTVNDSKNLYEFWGGSLTETINKDLKKSGSDIILNLASNEYFKAVKKKKLNGRVVEAQFKDHKNGAYKTIMVYAKEARGLMARFVLENKINNAEDLRAFDLEGYRFNPEMSEENTLVFTRG